MDNMSFMHFDGIIAAAEIGTVVTLRGGSVIDFDFVAAEAGWEFRNNGTVFKDSGGFFNQFRADTEWIIPHDQAAIDYQIRVHVNSGDLIYDTNISSTFNAFLALNVTRKWIAKCNAVCARSGNLIIDIRWQDGTNTNINNKSSLFDSANVMATAIYSITTEAGT